MLDNQVTLPKIETHCGSYSIPTMKIISFGDVHMATRNLDRMGEVMRDCDLVILSGDLTNFGGVDDARKVLADVRRACPAVLALRAISIGAR